MTAAKDTRATALAKLREPFPPEAISKLPKNVAKDGQASACNVCKGYHKRASLHLDYVGHAALTDRLLNADPEWNWRPMGVDPQGAPILERDQQGRPMGLWIWLSVAGLERPGYGSCDPGKADAVKELIGDALRNAAMRFGAALDLWHKGDLPHEEDAPAPQTSRPQRPTPQRGQRPADDAPPFDAPGTITDEQLADITRLLGRVDAEAATAFILKNTGRKELDELSSSDADGAIKWLSQADAERQLAEVAS